MINHPDCETIMRTIERFRDFLNAAWPPLTDVLGEHDWDNDAYFLEEWLDANWRLIVGRQLLGKEVDFQPFAVAINKILQGAYTYRLELVTDIPKVFVSLGSGRDNFSIAPPFDKAKVISLDGITEVLPWSALKLKIVRVA